MTTTELDADLAPEALDALQHAKSAFFGAQAQRCGYLRVAFQAHPETGELGLAASFSLGPERQWHHVDASIRLSDLDADPRPAVRRAFADLSDAMRLITIAHRFRPSGEAMRAS